MKKLYWQITIDRLLKYGGEVRKTSIGDNRKEGFYFEEIEIFFKDTNLSILLKMDERKGWKAKRGLCFLLGGDCGTVRHLFKGRREAIEYARLGWIMENMCLNAQRKYEQESKGVKK